MARLNKKQKAMIETLQLSMGNISVAADKAGIERKSHYNWLENNEKYKEMFNEVEERNLDLSESMLRINIRKGISKDIHFHLERKGKKRGYGKELTLAGDEENPLQVKTLNDFYATTPESDA